MQLTFKILRSSFQFALTVFLLLAAPAFCKAEGNQYQTLKRFDKAYTHSYEYMRTGNLDSAKVQIDSTFILAAKLESPFYRGKAFELKSRLFISYSNLDSAKFYSERSIEIYENFPDSLQYFIAVYNLGGIYIQMDDHIQGLVQFKNVIRIIDENFESLMSLNPEKVTMNRAYSYASIGIVYKHLHDYGNAINNFDKAIKVSYRVDGQESVLLRAITLGNIGETYFLMEDYASAENYAIAGLQIKEDLGMQSSTGYNYQILAMSAFGRGKYKLSLRYLEEADEIFASIGDNKELNRDNFWRAKNYSKNGNLKKAEQLLIELEVAYKQGFSQSEQAELYDLFSEVYAAQNNYKAANEYLLISRMIRKDVDLRNDKKMVGEFLNFFEDEESRLDDKLQSLKNQQEKEKLELEIAGDREKKVWVYSLFGVSIVCLLLIILIIAKAYQRNKRVNEKLSNSIDEKQLLFKEVHHRVKNNFQIISSLLNLQQGIEEDERGKKVLSDAQGRIQSMSLVHELLYRKNEVKKIGFESYTNELVASIVHSFQTDERKINYTIQCDDESFDLEVAIPLGLILNEAITNSVKYAFKGKGEGTINIKLVSSEGGYRELTIKDDGIGIPEEYINGSKETLGIELINILAEQLGGNVKFRNDNGTIIKLSFKVD